MTLAFCVQDLAESEAACTQAAAEQQEMQQQLHSQRMEATSSTAAAAAASQELALCKSALGTAQNSIAQHERQNAQYQQLQQQSSAVAIHLRQVIMTFYHICNVRIVHLMLALLPFGLLCRVHPSSDSRHQLLSSCNLPQPECAHMVCII